MVYTVVVYDIDFYRDEPFCLCGLQTLHATVVLHGLQNLFDSCCYSLTLFVLRVFPKCHGAKISWFLHPNYSRYWGNLDEDWSQRRTGMPALRIFAFIIFFVHINNLRSIVCWPFYEFPIIWCINDIVCGFLILLQQLLVIDRLTLLLGISVAEVAYTYILTFKRLMEVLIHAWARV